MSLNSMRENFKHSAKWIMGGMTVIMVAGAFAWNGFGNSPSSGAAGSKSTDVVATVNGEPITRSEYDSSVQNMTQQEQMFGQTITPLEAPLMHDTALEQLISAKLQIKEAERLGLKVSDADIEKARDGLITQSGIREKLSLKPTASISDIDAALDKIGAAHIEDQPSFSDDSFRQNLLIDKLQTYIANQVNITEQQARDSFTQYHTRHILIGNKGRSDAQAKVQAQQVLDMAQKPGADFVALAKTYSQDPGTKDKGGDDGWIDQSTGYVPEFKTAAFALKPGQVSPTLVSSPQYGYFIIKLDAIRSNLPKDFDKNKEKYISQVRSQKQTDAQNAYMSSLQNAASTKIVVKDPGVRGDRELSQALHATDATQRDSNYRAAVADYETALKSASSHSDSGELQAALFTAYHGLNDTAKATAALSAAVQADPDPQMELQLGALYQQNKQTDLALAQYQAASKQAWNDSSLHQNLQNIYQTMKRPDLAAAEGKWLAQYQAQQKQKAQLSSSGPGGLTLPPGTTLQTVPGGPSVKTTSGSAAPQGKKPGQ